MQKTTTEMEPLSCTLGVLSWPPTAVDYRVFSITRYSRPITSNRLSVSSVSFSLFSILVNELILCSINGSLFYKKYVVVARSQEARSHSLDFLSDSPCTLISTLPYYSACTSSCVSASLQINLICKKRKQGDVVAKNQLLKLRVTALHKSVTKIGRIGARYKEEFTSQVLIINAKKGTRG